MAVVGLLLDPDHLTRILERSRFGTSGETYLFDRQLRLVSGSAFDAQLRTIGLLEGGERSTFNIRVRDPGGDLTDGYRTDRPQDTWEPTRMARAALAGEDDVDFDGYRDYRGVLVVGAWKWLDGRGMGLATEVDRADAYAAFDTLDDGFWILAVVLLAAAGGIFLYSRVIVRLRREVGQARQVGQYTLDEKIGEGAWGSVYRASHALLRRPTAVKILRPEQANPRAIERFEREVQLTAQLTHPNTVAIYDYGRTPDGGFYYAMEYLAGTTLKELVEAEGPQPDALVARVMRQAAGSLHEAHAKGLVHRDVKPANIMLCDRGGEPQTVKVLDFGLVKNLEDRDDPELTRAGTMLGTPLYASPEGIRSPGEVDGRSDLYSLGAVAYYLLCGRHVFLGDTLSDIFLQHASADPVPPSQVLGRDVAPALERAILGCLAKEPDDRPANGRDLIALLSS